MRPELSHWYWYEKLTTILMKESPLIEFMPKDRKEKISDLLKQISYEIAGGLRNKVDEARKIANIQHPVEKVELNQDAVEKLRKLAL